MTNKGIKYLSLTAILIICAAVTGCGYIQGMTHDPTPDPKPHIITESERETNPVRHFKTNETVVPAASGYSDRNAKVYEELNNINAILQNGGLPDITGCDDDTADMFAAAERVLNEIILNSMTGYERIHAIHDYLAGYIDYDYDLYNKYISGGEINSNDPSFDARGVFLNKVAVCDGLSNAFVTLCGMEGIRAIRVTGTANGIAHSWNRVYYNSKWYNVDCTFDNFNININNTSKKLISHSYFMIKTGVMTEHKITNIFDYNPEYNLMYVTGSGLNTYSSEINYDYYNNERFASIGGLSYTYSANSQDALNTIFKYIADSDFKIGKIELRLTFVQTGDEWDAAVKEAYGKVKNANFKESGCVRGINNTAYFFIYT